MEEGTNCPLSLMKAFESRDHPTPISRVEAVCLDGVERLCLVRGWSSNGPDAVYAVRVDESGEGLVTRVFGGIEGIRLQQIEIVEPWDICSNNQWGEPYLLLGKNVTFR